VDRLPLPIVLQDKYAWSFVVRWIIFDHHSLVDTRYNIINENIVFCQFVSNRTGGRQEIVAAAV